MRKTITTAACLLCAAILCPHVNASINSDLIEAMKDAATPNKSVSREEWIAGIDALCESLVKADALISPDGGNKKQSDKRQRTQIYRGQTLRIIGRRQY